MPIKYRLVLRKDMTKGAAADSKLYYAVNKSTGTCDFEELCDQIADRSTASRGDVHVVPSWSPTSTPPLSNVLGSSSVRA